MKDEFHFIAIGGIGQSALAKILLEQGFLVSGSDISDSKYLTKLKELGAKIFIGHSADNIKGEPKVVVSTAIKENNPELIKAKELGLEILHRSDLLKLISEQSKKFIGFSGTHGKTTTSGLCSYVLEKLNLNPSYAIGGIIPEINTNAKSSRQYLENLFVAELDESDGSIVKYSPDILVINNLEVDHVDFYKDGMKQIKETFLKVYNNMNKDGMIFLNSDNSGNKEFLGLLNNKNKIVTFSLFDENSTYKAVNIEYDNDKSSFDVFKNGTKLGRIDLSVPAQHNVYNALAVICVLSELGLNFGDYKKHFRTFTGMGRRFQYVAEFDDIKIIDDYAHHPTEVASTLEAGQKIKKDRLVAIFQPHRYTRFKQFWNEFKESLKNCDLVIVTDVWSAGDDVIPNFKSEDFASQTENCIWVGGSMKEAGEKIAKMLKPNDTVLTLGAGDITEIWKVLKDEYCKHSN